MEEMTGTPKLETELLYSSGLRVSEYASLHIKDIDLDVGAILVRSDKGNIYPIDVINRLYKGEFLCE